MDDDSFGHRTQSSLPTKPCNPNPVPAVDNASYHSSTVGSYSGQYGCWAYDSFGNRTAAAMSTVACANNPPLSSWANDNANNRFASTSQVPGGVAYDAGGNVLGDGLNTYLYDGEGRVCAAKSEPSPGLYTMTGYLYDAEGRRVAKGTLSSMSCNPATNGFATTESYVLGQGGEELSMLGQNGVWQRTNVYGAGKQLATYNGAGLHFQLTDPLGTRRVQVAANGVAELSGQSLPFGDALACSGSAADATPLHFTGKERDAESGNDYFGARYYGSTMGRFMSPDPITVTSARQADPQQLNLYAYVRNNPLSLTDPSGMIINTDDLNDKDKALWAKIAALANKQDADGNYVNPALHGAYSALDSDSRTFRIEDDKSLGDSTAGRFEVTKFNGANDFSEAKVELNFGVIKNISSTTQGDYDPSFQKYAGLSARTALFFGLRRPLDMRQITEYLRSMILRRASISSVW